MVLKTLHTFFSESLHSPDAGVALPPILLAELGSGGPREIKIYFVTYINFNDFRMRHSQGILMQPN